MEGQVIEVIETKTIDFVTFFYREGAKGDDLLHKKQDSVLRRFQQLREHVYMELQSDREQIGRRLSTRGICISQRE